MRDRATTSDADALETVRRGVFTIGLLLPVLAGGNDFAALEPDLAILLFDLAAIGLAGLVIGRATTYVRPTPGVAVATVALSILCVLWTSNLVFRPSGPRALLEAKGMFAAAILYAVFARWSFDDRTTAALIRGLLIGTLVTAAYGQYQYWIAFPQTAPLLHAMGIPTVSFVNANFYNANCYAALLAAVVLVGTTLGVFVGDRVATLAVATLGVTLLLTRSRATMAMLILAGSVLAWFSIDRLRRRSFLEARWPLIVAVATGGAVAAAVVVHPRDLWEVGLLGRIAIWQGSWKMGWAHCWTGVGLGRFWDYYPQYQVNDYYTRYPHSFLLEIFAELGGGGLLAIVSFLVAAFAGALSNLAAAARDDLPRSPVGAAIVVASGLLVVHALVDIDWHAPANPILLSCLLGLAQTRRSDASASPAEAPL